MCPICRKRWHLFPPEDTAKLYPTRIPYEESSVFSQVAVLHPDLRRFPAFHGASEHIVTLQPGQVRNSDELMSIEISDQYFSIFSFFFVK